MGLLTENASQYYAGEQAFIGNNVLTNFTWTGDVTLVATISGVSNTNYAVYLDNVLQVEGTNYSLSTTNENQVDFVVAPALNVVVKIRILVPALWDNYGSYEYVTIDDIVNNFLVAYVGKDKLIPQVKRTDIVFHAKRGLQEFSYDTLRSIHSQELTIPPSLSLILPQDYVNWVEFSWIDSYGVKHIIYPTTLTSNPYNVPIQDALGVPTQDSLGDNLEGTSLINERWDTANDKLISGDLNIIDWNAGVYNYSWDKVVYGQRYGLEPETSNKNGWFTINNREGKISFSSNLKGKLILFQYISDGLSTDAETKVPKLAEEALYMHIAHAVLASRINIPEYIVQRYKKDRRAALRNAKIRLSDLKLNTLVQVMRNKSKWIKH